MMFKPLLLYVAGGALIIGVASGYKVRDWQCDAAYAKALEKAGKLNTKKQEVIYDVSQTYEAKRDQADVVATEAVRRGGWLTSRLAGENCYGAAKRRALEAWLAREERRAA